MPPIKRTKFKLAPEQLLEMFYWLKLIRAFDERLSVLVKQGKVRSGVYTGIGQEAIIVGTCFGLRKEDFICPLHRDLGSFLMKGVEPKAMMSQMFAKTTGLSKGRDSALHSGVSELGIFGNTSMLGANLPIAAGLGYTFKMEKADNVVDRVLRRRREQHRRLSRGAELRRRSAAAGRVHLREQPVRLLGAAREEHGDRRCGDPGGRATASTASRSTATTCWRSTRPRSARIARARSGGGPTLIECKTYRWHGHSEHDKAFYRTDEELAMWKSRDPIPTFTTYLRARHVLDDEKLKDVEARVTSTIDEAVEFAMNAPDPAPEEAVTDLYA